MCPSIDTPDAAKYILHVFDHRWFDPEKPRKSKKTPLAPQDRLQVRQAAEEVKNRIYARYLGRYDPVTGANPDKSTAVKCWACRDAWLGRGGGITCVAEAGETCIGFDVCEPCSQDRERLEAKVNEALADPVSPARIRLPVG